MVVLLICCESKLLGELYKTNMNLVNSKYLTPHPHNTKHLTERADYPGDLKQTGRHR